MEKFIEHKRQILVFVQCRSNDSFNKQAQPCSLVGCGFFLDEWDIIIDNSVS